MFKINRRGSTKKLILFITLGLMIYLTVISYIIALASFTNPMEAREYQPEIDGDTPENEAPGTPWLTMFAVSIMGIGLALFVLTQRGYLQIPLFQ